MFKVLKLSIVCRTFAPRTVNHSRSAYRFSSGFKVDRDLFDSDDELFSRPSNRQSRGKWQNSSSKWDDDYHEGPISRHLLTRDDQSRGDRDWGDRFTNLSRTRRNHADSDQPVQKMFYTENPAITERSQEEDQEYFTKHNITTMGQNVLRPVLNFDEISFPEYILKTMKHQTWTEPTPTQAMGWPLALSGRDVVGISRTGSGKTAAFLLPGLVHIMNQKTISRGEGPIFVCLVPTRELAQQVGQVAIAFARPLNKKTALAYGGARRESQLSHLNRGPEILVATPGRLLDFLENEETNMDRCTYLVLDEADRMLDMGFEPQIRKIIDQIRPDRQTLMYTATWPEEVQELAQDFQTDPVRVNIGSTKLHANSNITQKIEICDSSEKKERLFEILKTIEQQEENKTLIFVGTKRTADWLERKLNQIDWPAKAIHGDKSQSARDRILHGFREGRVPILVATDVASRGLDVKDIAYIVNMDFPNEIEDYVHRIGRTARGEKSGVAISIFTEEDYKLSRGLIDILKDSKQEIPEQLTEIAEQFSSNKRSRHRNQYRGQPRNSKWRTPNRWSKY